MLLHTTNTFNLKLERTEKLILQNQPAANSDSHTVVMLMPEDELKTWLSAAKSLLNLSEPERTVALNQITSNHSQQNADSTHEPSLAGFLKKTFTFPESYSNALLGKESPDCDKACTQARRNKILDDTNELSFNIVLGIFNPATKLKLFGSKSLKEGELLGEGKDAVVFALKGSSDWVIKVLKFGGAERAEMLVHYINQLAADASLKIPQVTSLGDGRILQPFVHGTATANKLWGEHTVSSQALAKELTSTAQQTLGIKEGEMFIKHPKLKIGVDPSFENFRFNESGVYQGWIDPIFEIVDHGPKR